MCVREGFLQDYWSLWRKGCDSKIRMQTSPQYKAGPYNTPKQKPWSTLLKEQSSRMARISKQVTIWHPRAAFICMPGITRWGTTYTYSLPKSIQCSLQMKIPAVLFFHAVGGSAAHDMFVAQWSILCKFIYILHWSKRWILLLTTQPSSGPNYHFPLSSIWLRRYWHARNKFCYFIPLEFYL